MPAKSDYWKGGGSDGMWPVHKPFTYMSERRFHTIWMNLHLTWVMNSGEEEKPDGETEIIDSNSNSISDAEVVSCAPIQGNRLDRK